MNNEADDIFADHRDELSDNELLKYLENQLNDPDKHALEAQMVDDAFATDALEGLQQLNSTAQIQQTVNQLNHKLQRTLKQQKRRGRLKDIPSLQWVLYAIFAILVLIITAYFVIHLAKKAL